MTLFKLSARAKSDLKNIARQTQKQWGRQQRNVYLKQFDVVFAMLAQSPEIGKEIDFVRAGYRKFPQASHVIFYRLGSESRVEIIRILHKSMDVTLNL
ncbi:MAG: type II toxin-antitoxin system RelE/ParE family toxin [Gammaproteobacteria bacterium]|nr:type II toxin-antitoxin system RelE/ParE family toxin [Gammaproteobacteria bacterium]